MFDLAGLKSQSLRRKNLQCHSKPAEQIIKSTQDFSCREWRGNFGISNRDRVHAGSCTENFFDISLLQHTLDTCASNEGQAFHRPFGSKLIGTYEDCRKALAAIYSILLDF